MINNYTWYLDVAIFMSDFTAIDNNATLTVININSANQQLRQRRRFVEASCGSQDRSDYALRKISQKSAVDMAIQGRNLYPMAFRYSDVDVVF